MAAFRGIARVAHLQYGAISRSQLNGLDVTRHELAGFVRRGQLERVQPDGFVVGGSPATWERSMSAALLSAGAGCGCSHRSAARLWVVHDAEVLEIRVPEDRQPRLRGVIVHRNAEPFRLVDRCGLNTTAIDATLRDLAAVVDARAFGDALDRALSSGVVRMRALERICKDSNSRGATRLRKALASRAPADTKVESLLEARFIRLVRASDLPAPTAQAEIRHGRRLVARVDFLFAAARLIIELDGLLAHNTAEALNRDLARQNELVSLGYTVIRFTWADVNERPQYVIATIRRVLSAALPL
jgi:very-short-patch-repair endonuclease